MVPVTGLEPVRLTAEDFESSKSTIPSHWHLLRVEIIPYYLLKYISCSI